MSSPDIEEIHRLAVESGREHYEDPATGYMVFTELAHQRRGYCCGNRCRHCPFGHYNVPSNRGARVNRIRTPTLLRARKRPYTQPFVDVLFWSGGKDSYLTLLHLALDRHGSQGHMDHSPAEQWASVCASSPALGRPAPLPNADILLLTTFDAESGNLPHQNLRLDQIMDQARHLKLDLLAVPLPSPCDNATYTRLLSQALWEQVIQASNRSPRLVFGDLHLQDIVNWRIEQFRSLPRTEPNQEALSIPLYFPLYQKSYPELALMLDALQRGADGEESQLAWKQLPDVLKSPEFRQKYGYREIRIAASSHPDVEVGSLYHDAFRRTLPESIDSFGEKGEFHTHVMF